MSDSNEDNENQNEDQTQVSKLPKPANIDNYFIKIQSNPKPWQIQAKIKPNPYDKNARITFKTHQNKFIGWDWKNNAKIKFQAKDGKTKVSINLKMLENGYANNYRKYKNQGNKQPSHQQKQKRQKQQKQKPILLKKQSIQSQNKDNKKQGKQNNNNNNSGDLDFNLSTSYDNSKFNLRLKDNGQINIKFNQSADVIPNTLKAQFQYLYEYKNKADIHKYMFELLYTTGVRRWVYGDVPNQGKNQPMAITPKQEEINRSKLSLRKIYKLLKFNEHIFHKNQTKIRGKIGSHCDVQIKLNSVNHFGNVKVVNQVSPSQVSDEKKQIKIAQQPKSETQGVVVVAEKPLNTELPSSSELQPTILPSSSSQSSSSSSPLSQNQPPLIKLQLQNKLTLKFPHNQYNFKTILSCESLPIKQNIRLQTIINRTGLHNIQSKYLCKYWAMYAFGAMLGYNWNQHAGVWNRKWEIIVQKQNVSKIIGNILVSVSDKCVGFRIMRKLGKIYKIQLMASRRWNVKQGDWPNFGVKVNANW